VTRGHDRSVLLREGIFNFFIGTPEIAASLFFGWVINHLLGNNRLTAVVAGAVHLILNEITRLWRFLRTFGIESPSIESQVRAGPLRNHKPGLALDIRWGLA
jgi:hypothetical protein